jgi:chitinase
MRDRVYCCDMASGKSPWLPVPLDYLFPQAPPDSASTDYKLSVDPTWGGKEKGGSPEPEDASFGFFVLSSPEALQVSLDKRDGSDWEVFDCHDAVSENTQTVRVMCTSDSEDSNCGKIFLGHGVPGTILEMPAGVRGSLTPSHNNIRWNS